MTTLTQTPARAPGHSAPIPSTPVQGTLPQQAMTLTTPTSASPAGEPTAGQGHALRDALTSTALAGSDSPEGQRRRVAHTGSALGGTIPQQARGTTTTISESPAEEPDSESAAKPATAPNPMSPRSLFDPTLYVLAQAVDDFEGQRKSQDNRIRILTTTEPDEDGEVRGFGLDPSHPVVGILLKQADDIKALEHQAVLALNRVMRKHPLAAWQKTQKGVGEKQLARLLAAIGDPYLRTNQDGTEQPRTVSALWAYSGLHTLPERANEPATTSSGAPAPGTNVAAKRRKGVKANWSTDAKTRAYLIATSCIKQDGEYREVYDKRRAHTATSHPDWTPGHSHNDALRIVSKRLLRDLWRAARDYHEGQ